MSLFYLADKGVMLDCMRIVWADGVEVCEVQVLEQYPDGAGFILQVEAPPGYLWLTPAAPIFTLLFGKRWRVTTRDARVSGADTPQPGSAAGPSRITLALVEAGPSV
ncbi:MAG: hypothetical protein ABI488_05405 [Polyangiaceae bacterium]